MNTRNPRSLSVESLAGQSLSRRGLLQAAAGAAALGAGLRAVPAGAEVKIGTASGELTVGSNYSGDVPKAGLHALLDAFPNKNVTIKLNEVDHNTFQENITTYLQNPDDVIPWFAGYRMQYFAAQGLLSPIDDVWAAGLDKSMSAGFKQASTGQTASSTSCRSPTTAGASTTAPACSRRTAGSRRRPTRS